MSSQQGKNYTFSYKKRFIKWLIFAFGMLMIGISFVLSFQENSSREPARIWLVDTSLSMKTKDISSSQGNISRIDGVKRLILGDVFAGNQGLMTFARVTSLQVPLTKNQSLFQDAVSNMQVVKGAGGSDISQAIQKIIDIYGDTKNLQIICISDGESFDERIFPENAPSHIQWNFIAIGTKEGGSIVENYMNNGVPRYKMYQGEKVISKLDTTTFDALSKHFSAPYFVVKNGNHFADIYASLSQVSIKQNFSFAYIFVFFGILSIIISFFVLPYHYYYYD